MSRKTVVVARCSIALVATLAAALAATPASAASHRQREVLLHLDGSHGYHVWIGANPGGTAVAAPTPRRLALARSAVPKVKPQAVDLIVAKGRRSTSYEVPGVVTARRVRADFGRFGRVSVFFHRRATHRLRLRKHERPCIVDRRGEFRGTIRFSGEHDYTSVAARRAHGHVAIGHLSGCVRSPKNSAKVGPRNADLFAASNSSALFASKEDGVPKTFVLALTSDGSRRVTIFRLIVATASLSSFAVSADGTSAHVDLPAPFAGSASFAAPHAWTGTLTGAFLGAPAVPLAGSDFKARLKTH